MSAVCRFFEPNEADCQLCKDKASLAELRGTDCAAQPLLLKGKQEHVHRVVILKSLKLRNISHRLK